MREVIQKRVGALAEAAMLKARVTQQHVADELNISQSQVSRRLAGKIPFDVAELEIVARLCGVPMAALVPTEEEAAA